jgi:HD-like signal output (HDOD) protein
MTLGFSTIKSVVIASSAKNLYSRGSAGLQERLFWEHALVSALAGRSYGRVLRFPRSEEVFLAALMHDIGKSVMGMKFPDRYGALIKTLYNEQGDFLEMELETFGFDHAMVGEALLRSWNLAQ